MHISVVIPVYGCKTSLIELYLRLRKRLKQINEDFEIILINDASPDNAWETIIELSQKDKKVKGINLSRNFGQHYAITAGLDYCSGDWVVVMDCDLQDQPEEIVKLYDKAMEGYDIVVAQRERRHDSFFKKTFSNFFYKLLFYFTNVEQDSSIANFGIYNKKVISNLLTMGDKIRFFPTMIKWLGFKNTKIKIIHADRKFGKTSYSFRKLINLAIDTILSFSDKPLRLTIKLGFFIVFSSILFTIYTIYKYLSGQIVELGWTSLIISIWLLSGIIIFTIGIASIYIGKIFNNVKNRPLYIIKEMKNLQL